MRETVVRISGLTITVVYAVLIGWLYARQPATIAEVTGGLSAAIGAYHVDQQAFEDGLQFFRRDQFSEARAAFARADPAQRDSRTQFYIAYSYYRQGWGRLYQDDELYRQGIEAVDRAIALAPARRIVVDDPTLRIHTADELKVELDTRMRRDASDLNPLRIFRERK